MAHRMYDTGRTMLIVGDAMGAARDQAHRMLIGAAALRVASAAHVGAHARLTSAREACVAAEAKRDAAMARLAATKARLARG